MHTLLLEAIHALTVDQRHALGEAIRRSLDGLENLLRLDEYHRHGHDSGQLQKAMGPLATATLNLGALSEVLSKGIASRAMPETRLRRVKALHQELAVMREECVSLEALVVSIGEAEQELLHKAEAHLDRIARVFRGLRMAQLEIRAKYDATRHDAEFAGFTWRSLSPAELRLCPPFVAVCQMDGSEGFRLRRILTLLDSGIPFKVALLRSGLRKAHHPLAGGGLPASLSVEMLPLSLRGLFFVQTCPGQPDFQDQLAAVLAAPRAGMASILVEAEGELPEAFQRRAGRAVRSRAFPVIRYDPDKADGFVSCLDIGGNPDPDAVWASRLPGSPEAPAPREILEEPYTFAHFAAEEPEFKGEFSDPAPGRPPGERVSVDVFLRLNSRQRVGKLPVVRVLDENGNALVRIASAAIAGQAADQSHLWRTLQELAGIANPHVSASVEALEADMQARHKRELDALREQLEKDFSGREQAAVANAVRRLVSHLTGEPVQLEAVLPGVRPDQS
jgi:hypothetical protein